MSMLRNSSRGVTNNVHAQPAHSKRALRFGRHCFGRKLLRHRHPLAHCYFHQAQEQRPAMEGSQPVHPTHDILVCVAGLTPQVITETLYALSVGATNARGQSGRRKCVSIHAPARGATLPSECIRCCGLQRIIPLTRLPHTDVYPFGAHNKHNMLCITVTYGYR